MDNREISILLKGIAELLAIKGEDSYKIMAYMQASRTIGRMDADVVALASEGKLKTISGVGDALAKKINEMVETGSSSYLNRLQEQAPLELLALFSLPGIGAKTISALVQKMHIKTLDDLKTVAVEGKIRKMQGFGPALEKKLLEGIDKIAGKSPGILLSDAYYLADRVKGVLEKVEGIIIIDIAGEFRRGVDSISEVALVAGCTDVSVYKEAALALDGVLGGICGDGGIVRASTMVFTLNNLYNVSIKVILCTHEDYFIELFYATGSTEHLEHFSNTIEKSGFSLSASGLYKNGPVNCGESGSGRKKEKIAIIKEEDIYQEVGMSFIPPELREGEEIIIEALRGELPVLLEEKDIAGDLHMHSDWSDGENTIAELAEYATKRGYKYIAITDHTRSLRIAGGLSVEKLMKQITAIKELRKRAGDDIYVFTGAEVDILGDGSLDLPDDILKQLDVVVASIHSSFRQSKDEITSRILSAISNPYVNIIGHLTGRLINKRDGYEVDLEAVFSAAAARKVYLEVNSFPDRLDLRGEHIRMAKQAGVKISVNTDAHSLRGMDAIKYGVITARRGGLTREDAVNTANLKYLQSVFHKTAI